MANSTRLGELLVREKLISLAQLRHAQDEQQRSGRNLGYTLAKLGYISDHEITHFLSQQYRVPTINLEEYEIDAEIVKLVQREQCERHRVIPVSRTGSSLIVAMADPTNLNAIDDLKFLTGYNIEPVIASETAILSSVEKYYNAGPSYEEVMAGFDEAEIEFTGEDDEMSLLELEQASDDAPVVRLVNMILLNAIKKGASDIHVEPYEKKLRVRYRVDGMLVEEMTPPLKLKNAICSRLKIMASLDIAERRLPQDGRIKLKLGKGREMDFRVSVLPTIWGEKIVLRLLDKGNLQLDMSKLGFDPKPLEDFLWAIRQPWCAQGTLVERGADRTARWFRVGVVTTALCALAAMLLPVAAAMGVLVGGAMFVVAQVGYTLATSVYDSLVVDVAKPSHRGRISGLAWALGLVGGIVAIVAALIVMRGVEPAAQVRQLDSAFVVAGALFAILAVPGLAGLRGLRASAAPPASRLGDLASSFRAVGTTLRRWREHLPALRVLFSFFLINDVLVTIQFFIAIVLSARFGLAVEGLLWLSLLYHLIAIPSTVLFGTLADRWGPKPTVLSMCTALSGAILLLAFGHAEWVPVAAVALLGLVFSSIQAVFRSLFASVVPAGQAAELFGFNAVAGRLSAALGPLIFGVAAAAFGSNTWALCLLFLPLVAGAWLLATAHLTGHGWAGERLQEAAIAGDARRQDAN